MTRSKVENGEPRNVSVLYFAQLAEQARCASEEIISEASTAAELFAELQSAHSFDIPLSALRVAVNHEFSTPDAALCDGDTVAFRPPLAGG